MRRRKEKFLLFALSPLVIGYLINVLIMKAGLYGMSMMFLSLLFAAYWIYGGYRSIEIFSSRWEANLWGNGIAAIDFSLIVVQLLIFRRFLPNEFGFATQMFYLPVVRISAMVRSVLFFLPASDMLGIFLISFLVMCLLYNIGYSLGLRN